MLEFIPSSYRQWAKRNVLINTLRVGVTDTKLHHGLDKNMDERASLIPMNRMANPDEIAEFVFWLSSQKNTYITGEVLSIAGGE